MKVSMGDLYRETKRVEALIQHAGSVNGLKISTMLKISVYLLGSSIGLILYYLEGCPVGYFFVLQQYG
jgi:hypothetical protein